MMATEEEAERALTRLEQADARNLGFSVATCVACGKPTLWKKGEHNKEPETCGRRACEEKML